MAVRPLVVSGRVDERALELLVEPEPADDEIVVAPFAAGLDVADVDHEIDVVVAIDFGCQGGKLRFSRVAVRHVSNQGKGERGNAASPVGRLLGANAPTQTDEAKQRDNTSDRSFHGGSSGRVSRLR